MNSPINFSDPEDATHRLTLTKSEEIYKLLINAVEDYAIFALDTEGFIQTWNLGGQKLKGYQAQEIIGKHFSIFYTQPDKTKNHPAFELEQAKAKGKYEEEGWRIRKDGSKFWANVVITAIYDHNGILKGFGKVTRDLSDRKAAEEKLRASEERFKLLVESVHDYSIFMLSPEGNVLTWNKGAERNTGYQSQEIIGQHFSKFYSPEDIAGKKHETELELAILNGRYEEEGWRYRKDGSKFWANVMLTPVYSKTEKLIGFAKITRNLTERKKAEDELKSAYAELENRIQLRTEELLVAKTSAEKAVVARDQFFSIASHELKTPITAMKLQIQLRRRNLKRGNLSDFASEKLERLCADDERQVDRLNFLVENMLDIAKLSARSISLIPENINLNELVADSAKRLAPLLLEAKIDISIHAKQSIGVLWDRHRIEQVMTNLLSNTAKYASGKPVVIELEDHDTAVSIIVRDQGIGIASDKHERVFNPFERVKNSSEVTGLGLGLFIVKQIVEAHGGKISVKSAEGAGAEFRITLPKFYAGEK